jgi:hypothetical protein
VLTEADGGPVAVVTAAANPHNSLLLADGLEAVVVEPPCPLKELDQHLCLEEAFDGGAERATAKVYQPHVRRIGEEKKDKRGRKTKKAPAWVVEGTMAWLNRFRVIVVRWAKKDENLPALNKLACALLWCRRLHRLQVN